MTRNELIDTIWSASNKAGEDRDCTVKALTAITGLDYDTVHAAFAKAGRKPRKGCRRHITNKAAKILGYELEPVRFRAKTAITVERDPLLRTGTYLIGMTHHLAAMIDGELVDWSQGRRKRINDVFKLTKLDAAPAAELQPVAFRPMAQTNTQLGLLL